MAGYFNLDQKQVEHGLNALGQALEQWRTIAKKNGLSEREIKNKSAAFEHEDAQTLKELARHRLTVGLFQ